MGFMNKAVQLGLVVLASCAAAGTQELFSIWGNVTDALTGRPVPDVQVFIPGIGEGAVSVENGRYILQRIPPGEYDLEVGVIGYRHLVDRVRIQGNLRRDFRLDAEPIPFNPVLVTATRSSHLQSAVTACSEVLTREVLGERNGDTVGEIMGASTSVLVKDNGGFAGIKTLSLRGSTDAQVLVLLDGQRLNTAQSGGVDLNFIPAEALERIEIVRGGHSALMGSDAMGGAVHLVTRDPDPERKVAFGIGHTAASFGTRTGNAYGSLRLGPSQSFMLASRIESRGDFSYRPEDGGALRRRENNDIRGDAFMFKTRIDAERLGLFQASFQEYESERGTADPIAYPSSSGRRWETRRLGGVDWQKQAGSVHVSVRTGVQTDRNRYRSLYEDDLHRSTSSYAEARVRWTVRPFVLLQSGIEWNDDRLSSTKFQNQRRETQSLYTEAEVLRKFSAFGRFWEWKGIPALRWDRYGGGKGEACPKIGVLFRTGKSSIWTARGNWGRSFRLPTFNDLFWPALIWPGYGGVRGNPELRPETGWHWDAGLSFQKIKPVLVQTECTFFQNRFNDLILWQSDADFVYAPVNVGRALIRGIETRLSLQTEEDRFRAELSPCWLQTFDRSDAGRVGRLPYRPEWKVDALVGFRISVLHVNFQYQHVGGRFTTAQNTAELPSYSLWHANAGVSRKIGALRVAARVQVNNVLNRAVSVLEGFPLPGRDVRLSLDASY